MSKNTFKMNLFLVDFLREEFHFFTTTCFNLRLCFGLKIVPVRLFTPLRAVRGAKAESAQRELDGTEEGRFTDGSPSD